MEIKGKIIVELPERGGVSQAGKEWMTKEFVLETEDRYPRRMLFSVFGRERIEQFNIQLGEKLTVMFDIDSKEYNGRWYNSITAWKVERENQQPVATEAPAVPPQSSEIFNQHQNDVPKNDDLPF
jgi:hypothetical protein